MIRDVRVNFCPTIINAIYAFQVLTTGCIRRDTKSWALSGYLISCTMEFLWSGSLYIDEFTHVSLEWKLDLSIP